MVVICLLGAIALVGMAGIILLIYVGAEGSDVAPLVALTGPAIGGVATLLVSTRTQGE